MTSRSAAIILGFLKSRSFRVLKICLLLLLVFFSGYLIIPGKNRSILRRFFSTSCIDYRQDIFSKKLTDKVLLYHTQSRFTGIKECKDEKEIKKRVSEGKLFRIKSGSKYIIDRMSYSYPFLIAESKTLLDEIGRRFREKTDAAGLSGAKFIVTSMTRTTENMRNLRRNNRNASVNSAHLGGNAFDISYIRFSCRKMFITSCDKKYLKEALAQVIWQLKEEDKCWATYEKVQNCYHIVSR
jgi:uncharacterized protein YcbK (DUF882 family)